MAHSAGKQSSVKRSSPEKMASAEIGRIGNGTAQSMTDLDFLRGLIEAVDRSGIDTFEINRAGTRIRIAKTPPAAAVTTFAAPPAHAPAPPQPAPAVAPNPAPSAAGESADASAASPAKSNLVDVTSPMVGTFYRAPAPDAPPYVEVGSAVSRGQTLCILEAMKLMNELQNEVDGIVREVLVEDADPVEFGQVLFRIEPSGSK
jgi:acetyl-CoA carboxylase biotin carboxyl carrier protein